ncbi:hypothetical protein SLS62_009872 [Diatrype stigma]|uniref:Carboxypeptidase n=1 Tax=Diatrype stigma TaxID=117547 RepID=A0AAN9YJG0_9PEZI
MLRQLFGAGAAALALLPALASGASSSTTPRHNFLRDSGRLKMPVKRQVPADPTGVTTISTKGGATIRYKEPGKEGVCETTPGVNSYSGYVDLDEDTHMFFWFFEARHNPNEAPLTLWLNGGPGSDSLIGLFEARGTDADISSELGPCNVTKNLTSHVNPYSWNEASNLLFLSQPIGVGLSYDDPIVGVINQTTGLPVNSSNPDGRYSYVDPYRFDTTKLAAVGAWEVLQGFLDLLPTLDSSIKSRTFNLWTESYGGHWGPTFYRHFYEQNQAIQAGTAEGVELNMHTLGIINGIVSERIQAPYYPDIDYCIDSDRSTVDGQSTCAQATAICRNLVEGPYYEVSGRNPYDIRAQADAEIPPGYWADFVNLASTQEALGVNINYTSTSSQAIWIGFSSTGDFVFPDILSDLEAILDDGVSIHLVYGDADYICNWFGGEALSLSLNYTHADEFRASGYEPFVVDGVEYGEGRQHGNFSFTRVYDSGHEVPYYQPKAALELFRRVINDLVISDGSEKVTPSYGSEGPPNATHTNVAPTPWYTGQPGINDKRGAGSFRFDA